MNLIVPVNLQALRVAPNDATAITKQGDLFAGPTTSFEKLPWRDLNGTEHADGLSKANISANVVNSLAGNVAEQLSPGIHLHWALPDGLTRGIQQSDGRLLFPAVPNRWLISRILQLSGQVQAKQWIVESDYLMTEAEYTQARRKSIAIPVGWNLIAGNDPKRDGGALYYPPSRRMGKVFELQSWQPTATMPGAPIDQIRHLDEMKQAGNAFVGAGLSAGPLTAVGANGAAFAAYYPDSSSAFGFHDTFDDLAGGFDLGNASFRVSYQIAGWHSHFSDDPLQSASFSASHSKAVSANQVKPVASRLDGPRLLASVVLDTYRWYYEPAGGLPSRCLYGGQVIGVPWDTTGGKPNLDARFPGCYLVPMGDDPTVRVAVGNSAPGALAALVKQQWTEWAAAKWAPSAGEAPAVDERIEKDLEFLLDALQLGLLHRLGTSSSLTQLEQTLHQSGFGSLPGGRLWTIRPKQTTSDKADPTRFAAPDAALPDNDSDLAGRLHTLNAYQSRLESLLNVIESCQQQIFLDWYHYIAAVYSGQPDDTNKLKEDLKNYIGGQILDLWAKLDAAFGRKAEPSPTTGNVPVYFSNASNYITERDGRYAGPSPKPSLAGQIVAAANELLDLLAADETTKARFELQRTEDARYWQPQEPVVVATGDGLTPARRNGIARNLACRLSGDLLTELKTQAAQKQATLTGHDAASLFSLAVPKLAAATTPEATDTRPLLEDITALLGEACLLDFSLAGPLAAKLGTDAGDLEAALTELSKRISEAWQQVAKDGASSPVITNPTITANSLKIVLTGTAPQGVALTQQAGESWNDPFLPLFLVWEADYRAFEKADGIASPAYDPAYVARQFRLDQSSIELTFNTQQPRPAAGAAQLTGAIPLSSRAAVPLLDQIEQYLAESPGENPRLQSVIDHMRDKPLLSQGLSGLNPAMVSRAVGLQLTPFDPFYDFESPAIMVGAADDNLDYINILTHFVESACGPATDQVPLGTTGYSPLRSGYLGIRRADVVDVFGRKRRAIDPNRVSDAKKVVVSWQMRPPVDGGGQIYLPPRLARPARLRFDLLSAADDGVVTSPHPSTSPVRGWIVPNHLDNSLMLFSPIGQPLGSLGAFGAQTTVAWQPAPGRPAQTIDQDLAGDILAHLRKFADFIHGQPRAFFDDLMLAIAGAHTYILPADAQAAQALAVLIGQPLALVRAGLRLELAGLPAFETSLDQVRAALSANTGTAYDWTRRSEAGLAKVEFPVRLGDRDHLEDGLVGFLLDSADPYDTLYAPAAKTTGGTGITRPAPDTVRVRANANIDPPATPYSNPTEQISALLDVSVQPARTLVTLLMDPRASVHAAMGILPVKEISLPAEIYSRALRSIEVAFFTHPLLRGAQGVDPPVPDEAGYLWRWTMGVKQGGTVQPHNEPLLGYLIGDRAHFSFSPQLAQDGWLTLVPQPKDDQR